MSDDRFDNDDSSDVDQAGRHPRNHIGRPVQGDDFFDRERAQRRIWRDLDTDNLLLLAPRRVGKTSLMRRLETTAESQGFHAVYVTVADVVDEPGFVKRLYEAVLQGDRGPSLGERLRSSSVGRFLKTLTPEKVVLGPVGIEFSAEGQQRWEELGDALAHALEGQQVRWLIMVDELPVFVLELLRAEDETRTRRFLNWFRALRQGPGDVRWLLAGSIGLDTVAALHNLADTINDLALAEIGAFEPEVARAFIDALETTHQLGLTPDARDWLVERVGWPIPFFLQLLYRQLRNLVEDGEASSDRAGVDRAWEELLRPSQSTYFEYWRQRLHEQLGRALALRAEKLLNAATVAGGASKTTLSQVLALDQPEPEARAQELEFLLRVLRNDGYLVEDDRRWRFQSPLLRDWWGRFHGA